MPGTRRTVMLACLAIVAGAACGSDLSGPEAEGPIYLMREQGGELLPRTFLSIRANGDTVRQTLRRLQVQFRTDFITLQRYELHVDSSGGETVIVGGEVGQYERLGGDTVLWCVVACGGAGIVVAAVLTEAELVIPTAPGGTLEVPGRYDRYRNGDSLLPWQ